MSFLGELKRRKVLQVAVIYGVTAWVIVQVVATVEDPLNRPDWFDTAVIVMLAAGFPIGMFLSWSFDFTAHGVVKETVDPPDDAAAGAESGQETATKRLPNSIAVLPFENLSPNADDACFAAGMHEQLLNELAKIRGINVIARTSVLRYGNDPQPIPHIAEALNVGTVMEGSVRYAGDKVRVTAQLIDGTSRAHLWTEAYDGDLSDIFKIQTDIATTIAKALHAELLPEFRAELDKPPTEFRALSSLDRNACGRPRRLAVRVPGNRRSGQGARMAGAHDGTRRAGGTGRRLHGIAGAQEQSP